MDTKDLIIGVIIGGLLVWILIKQQDYQLMLKNTYRNYENDEICIVKRDKEGFISELRTKRDAHVNR